MNDNEINELLAIEVMKFLTGTVKTYTVEEWSWRDSDGVYLMRKDDWSPITNISQALECAEALDGIVKINIDLPIKNVNGLYIVWLFTNNNLYHGIGETKGRSHLFTASHNAKQMARASFLLLP